MNKKEQIKKYILYFFIYAISGWILETIYAIICGNPEKRGFLYGPLCPIYGFGAIAILFLLKKKSSNVKSFFLILIVLTIAEYIVSYMAEALFGIRLWDYSTEPFNIAGRICIVFSLIWGIGGIFFVRYIHPFLERNILKIKNKVKNIVLLLATSIFFLDVILSVIKYVK